MAWLTGLLVFTGARGAQACGATPLAWWSFKAPVPAHGSANVAVDAAIVLPLQWFSEDSYPPVRSAYEVFASTVLGPRGLTLEVTDQWNRPITGEWRPF